MTASNLKIIALITMIIDHIGAVLFPQHLFLRMVGRIAFPIYAFFIAQGCMYTKNKLKYLLRLFIFALIAQIPYDLCFNTKINFFYNTNTIYTMFLAVFLIFIFQYINNLKLQIYIKFFINSIVLFLFLSLSVVLKTDYNWWGISLILIFYYFKESTYIFAITLIIIKYLPNLGIMCLFNLFPILLVSFYNNKKGHNLKWLFYIAYPLHLLIIALIN